VDYVCIILLSAKCASSTNVSPPSAYEQYNVEDVIISHRRTSGAGWGLGDWCRIL